MASRTGNRRSVTRAVVCIRVAALLSTGLRLAYDGAILLESVTAGNLGLRVKPGMFESVGVALRLLEARAENTHMNCKPPLIDLPSGGDEKETRHE